MQEGPSADDVREPHVEKGIINDPEIDSKDENKQEEEEEEEDMKDEPQITTTKSCALATFRDMVEEAILANSLILVENVNVNCAADVGVPVRKGDNLKDIKLWGVPLLPSAGHGGTDIVLRKFLKAKCYRVHKAFSLLQQTLNWRAEYALLDDNSRPEMDCRSFAKGRDKEGRLLFYTVLGKQFRKKFMNTDSDYFKWRIRCVERGIASLDFSPGGVDSFIQIIDFKNAPGIVNREIKLTYKKMHTVHKKRYPGIVYRTLAVNVPSWFLAINALNLRYIAQRANNRFIFVKPFKVTETLLRYATIENILVQYGGLNRENDTEFSMNDKILESEIKPNSTEQIMIPSSEAGSTVTWDMTVVGYDVMYREEFVPDDDCSYTVLLQEKKMGESIRNSFYIREPGNIVITISNATYNKKKAFYRYKSSPVVPVYACTKL